MIQNFDIALQGHEERKSLLEHNILKKNEKLEATQKNKKELVNEHLKVMDALASKEAHFQMELDQLRIQTQILAKNVLSITFQLPQ